MRKLMFVFVLLAAFAGQVQAQAVRVHLVDRYPFGGATNVLGHPVVIPDDYFRRVAYGDNLVAFVIDGLEAGTCIPPYYRHVVLAGCVPLAQYRTPHGTVYAQQVDDNNLVVYGDGGGHPVRNAFIMSVVGAAAVGGFTHNAWYALTGAGASGAITYAVEHMRQTKNTGNHSEKYWKEHAAAARMCENYLISIGALRPGIALAADCTRVPVAESQDAGTSVAPAQVEPVSPSESGLGPATCHNDDLHRISNETGTKVRVTVAFKNDKTKKVEVKPFWVEYAPSKPQISHPNPFWMSKGDWDCLPFSDNAEITVEPEGLFGSGHIDSKARMQYGNSCVEIDETYDFHILSNCSR